MRAIKTLIVLVLSLGLVASAYGDVQAKKTDKKKPVKQEQKIKKDTKKKSGIKKVFSNPFKHQPKSQEADCRKYPHAAGCPNAKQAKQMAKQVNPSQPKNVKHSKPGQKSAKKNGKGKATANKAKKDAKSKTQQKNQHA